MSIGVLAVDLAMGGCEVGGVGRDGAVLAGRAMSRTRSLSYPQEASDSIVALEACTTLQHWGRVAQSRSHQAWLVPRST